MKNTLIHCKDELSKKELTREEKIELHNVFIDKQKCEFKGKVIKSLTGVWICAFLVEKGLTKSFEESKQLISDKRVKINNRLLEPKEWINYITPFEVHSIEILGKKKQIEVFEEGKKVEFEESPDLDIVIHKDNSNIAKVCFGDGKTYSFDITEVLDDYIKRKTTIFEYLGYGKIKIHLGRY